MAYQAVFERSEIKYLLSRDQKQRILDAMEAYMLPDSYGRTTIRNIYFDTENYRLIRRSMEKPVYKEKLRLRSYVQTQSQTPVFMELKKKYHSIVYKRRLSVIQEQAVDWICNGSVPAESQIAKEIDYFINYYQTLRPVIFLSYEREAYHCPGDGGFRITFDDHILARQDRLSLSQEVGGVSLLEEGMVLMEIKTCGGIPMWLLQVLSREQIYKTSFSKYGKAYEKIIFPRYKGEMLYA